MIDMLLGLSIAVLMGFSIHFLNTTSNIKGENIVIRRFGKKTIIPIKEVVSIECIDMIRSFQANVRTKNQIHYITFSYDMEDFLRKIATINPSAELKIRSLDKKSTPE